MKRTCGMCKRPLGASAPASDLAEGICAACLKELVSRARPMQEFLDGLDVPLLVVDDDSRVRFASRKAREVLGKEPQAIDGRYAGDAIACVHANEVGGCGKTLHCKTCAIRSSVADTYRTGRPSVRVPAYADVAVFAGTKPVRFIISTEKVGDLVMLRIDDVVEPARP